MSKAIKIGLVGGIGFALSQGMVLANTPYDVTRDFLVRGDTNGSGNLESEDFSGASLLNTERSLPSSGNRLLSGLSPHTVSLGHHFLPIHTREDNDFTQPYSSGTIISPTLVPEPAFYQVSVLMGLGGIGLFRSRRKVA